jgi:hypothetical protein
MSESASNDAKAPIDAHEFDKRSQNSNKLVELCVYTHQIAQGDIIIIDPSCLLSRICT